MGGREDELVCNGGSDEAVFLQLMHRHKDVHRSPVWGYRGRGRRRGKR